MYGTLILNDGFALDNSSIIESYGQLYVYIRNGSTIRTVFDLLIDPNKTARIEETQPGQTTVKEGFTRLIAVRDEGNGLITAVLGKQ